MLGPGFVLGRRGGSKRNRVAISESINDASFGSVVGRHFHFHSVSDCKSNEALAHLPGNVRENQVIVRQRNAKHGSWQDAHDSAFQIDGFFRIHAELFGTQAASLQRTDLPAIARERTLPAPVAIRPWTLFARTRFINVEGAAVEFVAVKRAHRGAGLCAIVHGDERKSARFAREPVHH